MNKNMTVFIVDDDPAVRDSLALMIEQSHLIVESFDSARAFLDHYRPEMQGCVIVDLKMPDMNGIELQDELIARSIPLPVIFLTGHGSIPLSVKTIKAGASDFLTKPVSREKLLPSIHAALQEYRAIHVRHKINQHSKFLLSTLSGREQQVMQWVLVGESNKKIAQHLGISHRTVEIHKARLMQKTGANNSLELARIAQEAGIPIGVDSQPAE